MSDQLTNVDRRIRKSKAALKEALLTLMQTKDFKKISITDIVRLADLNRGTFYKHFQYKEELLEEIIDDVMKDLTESYRAPYENLENFDVSQLTASAIKIFKHVATYANFYTLFGKSNILTGLQNRICDTLTQLFSQDLSRAPLNPNINVNILASYQAHAVWGMIVEWIDSEFLYTSDYMAEQLLVIVQRNFDN
ncbi:TetR/AcrR family transcriptional regulator [Sporosarcina sp. FSL K6-3457]|uniref:TetR/AcrR family transcriptional regulator n=1 Tax=Sporosarcina sp. FSL K6-3457 TaxID=2978204 RepID=UPI0030FA764D